MAIGAETGAGAALLSQPPKSSSAVTWAVPVDDEKSPHPSDTTGTEDCTLGACACEIIGALFVIVGAGDAQALDDPPHGSMLIEPLGLLLLLVVGFVGCAGFAVAVRLKAESSVCGGGAGLAVTGAVKSNRSFTPLCELVCGAAEVPQPGLAALAKSPKPLVALVNAGRDVAFVVCTDFGAGFESKKFPPPNTELCCPLAVVLAIDRCCCCCCCCCGGGLARFEKTAAFATGGAPPKLSPLNASFMDPKFEDCCANGEAGFVDG